MSALIDELYDHMNMPHDTAESHQGAEFRITNDSGAAWAIRKIKKANERLESVTATVVEQTETIHAWAEQERERENAIIDKMESYLHQYMLDKQAADPKLKTLRVPGGKLSTRESDKHDYDEPLIMAWAKTNCPEAIATKTSESLIKDAVKKHFKDTGEAIPGYATWREASFTVKLLKEGETENE